jgi:hypothetical protein
MPGKLLQALKRVKTSNPVVLLDGTLSLQRVVCPTAQQRIHPFSLRRLNF